MRLYCGIDLHSNNSMISLIDEADRVVSEKRLDNKLEAIEHHLQPYQNDISGVVVVVESTYNCYWLVDGLIGFKGWLILGHQLLPDYKKTHCPAGFKRMR